MLPMHEPSVFRPPMQSGACVVSTETPLPAPPNVSSLPSIPSSVVPGASANVDVDVGVVRVDAGHGVRTGGGHDRDAAR